MTIEHGNLFLVDFNHGSGHEYQGKRPAIDLLLTYKRSLS